MLKKIIKKTIIFIVIMLIVWAIVLSINIARCLNYKEPITFLAIDGLVDETGGEYVYPGYSFEVHTYYMGEVWQTKMKFLNMTVFETPSLYTSQKISKYPENVKIEIIKSSINKNGMKITITDNNENPYMWNNYYIMERKNDNNWEKLEPKKEITNDINYNIDENNQITIEINWTPYYGTLEDGTYRIVKEVYDKSHGYINIHSNEFEIVK